MAMRSIGCFVVLMAGLSACSDSNAPQGRNPSGVQTAAVEQTSGLPRILETFNVGKDVFVRALAVDAKNGALWVGTSLGVHEIDLATRAVRRTITREQGLANEYVFAILAEPDGGVWFGTNGGGMTHLRDTKTRTYFPMHGLADYWVYAFARQSNGALWVGTWAGANRFAPDTGRFTTYLKELVNEWVYGIGVDSRDRVWFGTEGGVSMFDGRLWHAWTHDQGLGAPNNDKLPISTNTGLGTRSRHDLSVMADGSPTYNPNYVFCIHVDSRDRVWAGTWGASMSIVETGSGLAPGAEVPAASTVRAGKISPRTTGLPATSYSRSPATASETCGSGRTAACPDTTATRGRHSERTRECPVTMSTRLRPRLTATCGQGRAAGWRESVTARLRPEMVVKRAGDEGEDGS